MTTLTKAGPRVYLTGLPFGHKDAAKRELGANWDGDRRAWWVGAGKAAAAEAFVARLNAAPAAAAPAPEDTDGCRVYAKVTYKGRTYFVVAETRDRTRCRLAALDKAVPPFWADCPACTLVKEYAGREVRGRTVYQTLGGIRAFVAGQKAGEAAGLPACAACGRRSDGLWVDDEDGLSKCRGCCDMPGYPAPGAYPGGVSKTERAAAAPRPAQPVAPVGVPRLKAADLGYDDARRAYSAFASDLQLPPGLIPLVIAVEVDTPAGPHVVDFRRDPAGTVYGPPPDCEVHGWRYAAYGPGAPLTLTVFNT